MLEFVLLGLALGLYAGLMPGPLMALIISTTIKQGPREGSEVVFAPLITDSLIITFVLLVLLQMEDQDILLGIISLVGAAYLIYLGYRHITEDHSVDDEAEPDGSALKHGIIVNFLSPHPYLFWIVIGAPILFRGLEVGILAPMLFILLFYAIFIISKLSVVQLVYRSRSIVDNKYYIYVIKALGVFLIIFALFYVKDGLELLR